MARGFTLVETLIVVSVLIILFALALPLYFRTTEKARSAQALVNMAAIRRAQLDHQAQYGTFVEALDLPTINTALELDLSARDFDYQIERPDQQSFVVVATSRQFAPGASESLRITMDQAGKTIYHWPGQGTSTGGGGGGGGGSGIGGLSQGPGGGGLPSVPGPDPRGGISAEIRINQQDFQSE